MASTQWPTRFVAPSTTASSVAASNSHVTPFPTLAWQFILILLEWVISLPSMVFSSDPARFLPAKRKHRHHHHTSSNHSSHTAAHHHKQHSFPAAIAPVSPVNTGNSVTVAEPPVPFLSVYSFPLPSSCLPAARFFYNLDEVPWPVRLWSKLTGGVSNMTFGSVGGAVRASTGSEALALLSRKQEKKKRWTLVLDLDETLVHTTNQPLADYDCRVEIHTRRAQRVFYISKRPYLDTFLATLATAYDIVIFTASIRRYADAVIDLIDVHRVVSRRFFRPTCLKHGASFLKDLRGITINGDLRRTILIDNSPVAYTLQQENALPIRTWTDDPTDTALRDLIPFLLALRATEDVRPLLYRRHLLQRTVEPTLVEARALQVPQIPVTASIIEQDEAGEVDEEEDAAGPNTTVRPPTKVTKRVQRT
jgi:CTD nuclear envelope phosphatase 1